MRRIPRPATDRHQLVGQLRAQLATTTRIRRPVHPVHPVLAELLPAGGLLPGSAYSVRGGPSLIFALLSDASAEGTWCGVVGMPEIGAEAAAAAGIRLERLALVPHPGERWPAVTAALLEAVGMLALRPGMAQRPAETSRLSARLRDREGVLLVEGAWPGAAAAISVADPLWRGLGRGHGHLVSREVTLTVTARHELPRSARVLLPDATGAMAVPPHSTQQEEAVVGRSMLRAVG